MEKNHTENITKEITKVDDILCNKCGKSTKHGTGKFAVYEGCKIQATFGYGSTKDGDREIFDICDQCFIDFINTFTHQPVREDMDRKWREVFGVAG